MTVTETEPEPARDDRATIKELVQALQEDMQQANYNGDLTHFTQQKPVSGRYYLKATKDGKVGLIPDAFFGDIVEMVSWMLCKMEEQRISSRCFDETAQLVLLGADMQLFDRRKQALSAFFVALRELNVAEQPVAIDVYNNLTVHDPPEPKQKSRKPRRKRDIVPPMRRKRVEEPDVDPFDVDRQWYEEKVRKESRLMETQAVLDYQQELDTVYEECHVAPYTEDASTSSDPADTNCTGDTTPSTELTNSVSTDIIHADEDQQHPSPVAEEAGDDDILNEIMQDEDDAVEAMDCSQSQPVPVVSHSEQEPTMDVIQVDDSMGSMAGGLDYAVMDCFHVSEESQEAQSLCSSRDIQEPSQLLLAASEDTSGDGAVDLTHSESPPFDLNASGVIRSPVVSPTIHESYSPRRSRAEAMERDEQDQARSDRSVRWRDHRNYREERRSPPTHTPERHRRDRSPTRSSSRPRYPIEHRRSVSPVASTRDRRDADRRTYSGQYPSDRRGERDVPHDRSRRGDSPDRYSDRPSSRRSVTIVSDGSGHRVASSYNESTAAPVRFNRFGFNRDRRRPPSKSAAPLSSYGYGRSPPREIRLEGAPISMYAAPTVKVTVMPTGKSRDL